MACETFSHRVPRRLVELIRFEHITADHHETGVMLHSDPADLEKK